CHFGCSESTWSLLPTTWAWSSAGEENTEIVSSLPRNACHFSPLTTHSGAQTVYQVPLVVSIFSVTSWFGLNVVGLEAAMVADSTRPDRNSLPRLSVGGHRATTVLPT